MTRRKDTALSARSVRGCCQFLFRYDVEDDAAFERKGVDGKAVAPDAEAKTELVAGRDAEERKGNSGFEDFLQRDFCAGSQTIALGAQAFCAVLLEQRPGLDFAVEDTSVEAESVF